MINANDETIALLDLECLVRVYMNDITLNNRLTETQSLILRGQINKAIMKLDKLRGYNFDIQASTTEWLNNNFT